MSERILLNAALYRAEAGMALHAMDALTIANAYRAQEARIEALARELEADMKKVQVLDDNGELRFVDVAELGVGPSVPGIAFPQWENVSGELLWGFKNEGMTKWPALGNGKYQVLALFLGKTVILDAYAEIGSTSRFPAGLEDRAWWFRPLTKRLTPVRGAVGTLKIYFSGKGALTGGEACWELNRSAQPPYWYLILRHSTMNPTGGALSARFPSHGTTPCWAVDGSNWRFQIIYEVE